MNSTGNKRRIMLMGDARQVHLSRWQQYLSDSGYEVMTVSLEPVDRIAGVTHRLSVPQWLPQFARYPFSVPAVKKLIACFEPHLINAHFVANYGVVAAMTGFTPWVLSTWGSDVMVLPGRSAFHMFRTRRVIQSADYITSDATVMSERLVELGADAARVLTFPYGVDRHNFYPAKQQPHDAPRILSNRQLEPVYGIDTVVDAFARLSQQSPASTLSIVGTGSMERELRAQALRSGANDGIEFAGEVAHSNMPDVLRRHDIFVSMSRSDTTSVSLLEAMACGVFPIVSDIPANREWIEDGQNGMLVSVGDSDRLANAIARAWGDRALRAAAVERNQHIIEERADWTHNMAVAADLFGRLTGRV